MNKRRFLLLSPWALAVATVLGTLAANLWANGSQMSRGNFELGGEYGKIAEALVSGRGFSDPFANGAGATGWMPPAFSLIIAGAMLVTDSVVGAVWVLIVLKALGLGMQAGLYASLVRRLNWAPAVACFAVVWALGLGFVYSEGLALRMHDGWWVGSVFALMVWGFAELGRPRGRAVLAVGSGLAAVSSPVLLAVLPVLCGLRGLCLIRRRRDWFWSRAVRPVLPGLVTATLVAVTWTARTRATVGVWAPIKTNGAYEMWQAQCMAPRGVLTSSVLVDHPFMNGAEAERYRVLGERSYLAAYWGRFWTAVRQAPGDYVWRVYNRAANAFGVTDSDEDRVVSPRLFSPEVMARLWELRIAKNADEPDRMVWLHVGAQSEEGLREKLSGIDAPVDVVVHHWRLVQTIYARNLWRDFLRGLMQAGLPMAAFLIAVATLTGRARRLAWTGLAFYAAYLAPYVLISHYARYQIPLQGLQAAGVVLGALAMREMLARRRRGAAPRGLRASV